MNTFIRQKAEEIDDSWQTNKQTMPTQSNNTEEINQSINQFIDVMK